MILGRFRWWVHPSSTSRGFVWLAVDDAGVSVLAGTASSPATAEAELRRALSRLVELDAETDPTGDAVAMSA